MALQSEIPTAAEFEARFPSFDVATTIIDAVIAEAARSVGEGWEVEDQKPAILYLTAHMLTMEDGDVAGRGVISSESFGPMSTSYKVSDKGGYDATEYGRRFANIRRRNVGSPVVVGGIGPE